MALLLQNFDLALADPQYKLTVRRTLTIKPKGLLIHAGLREGLTPAALQRRLLGGKAPGHGKLRPSPQRTDSSTEYSHLQELLVCYGSNTGTCQALAHILSRDAIAHGFNATMKPMDKVEPHHVTASIPIVVITASYEGKPPDNAAAFVKWLQGLTESPFDGVHHAVFGCGNRDWAETFQRIPKLVDDIFKRCGSIPLLDRGASDAVDSNIANEFDAWADNGLWPALRKLYHPNLTATPPVRPQGGVKIVLNSRNTDTIPDGAMATVEENHVLTAPNEPEKRHMRIRLPSAMTYQAGDHLVIMPANHEETVRKVMNRFGLAHDAKIVMANGSEYSIYTHLRDFVEINHVATEKVRRSMVI